MMGGLLLLLPCKQPATWLLWATVCCCCALAMMRAPLPVAGDAIGPQKCDTQTSQPCPTMVGYLASANVALSRLAFLFSRNYTALLGPNDIDPSLGDLSNLVLPASTEKPYLVPQTCGCIGGSRVVNSTVYTVVKGDTLSAIAELYLGFATYQQIANVSNIADPNLIQIGQKVRIPIPCSCLDQDGAATLSLSYQIQKEDSFSHIAQLYNVSALQLQDVNSASNASDLQLGEVLFVPLSVCKANFSSGALDGNLTVVEGAYKLTAGGGCVQCSCHNGTLHCVPASSSLAGITCSNMTCPSSNLVLGARSTSQVSGGCSVQSCVYKGYNASSGIISSLEVEQDPTCPAAPPPEAFYKPPSGLVAAPLASTSPTTSGTSGSPPPPSIAEPPSLSTDSNTAAPLSVGVGMSLSALWWLLLVPTFFT